jgi:hypothetical protein
VRHHLNNVYGLRWIGRGGPTAWPARSPDLNSCDYYLWGYMKAKVYRRTRVENQRVEACIRENGDHFEHSL